MGYPFLPKFGQKSCLFFFGLFLKNLVISFSWNWSKLKTNIAIDISPLIPYLAKFWILSYGPKCCWPTKFQDSLKWNIARKKWMMKFIFGMQISSSFSTSWYYHFGCAWPTAVHSAVFTGHLVHACVVVVLIFCYDNSLIMRWELTFIHQKIFDFVTKTWENIIWLFLLNVWRLKSWKHINIWRALAKNRKNNDYKNGDKITIFDVFW